MTVAAKEVLDPAGVAKPAFPYYANAVRSAGDLLFLAGQVGWDEQGRVVGVGDVEAQTRQTLKNIQRILEHSGASVEDIVKVTVYVTDMGVAERIAPIRTEFFGESPPVSTIVEVSRLLTEDLLIEIDAVAVCRRRDTGGKT